MNELLARRSSWLPWVLFAAAVAHAAHLIVLELGANLTFFYDEWAFVLKRRGHSLDTFLAPHNEHLSLIPIAVYKAMLEVAPEEIKGYGLLTWIRCMGRCREDSIMNAASRTPIIETAVKTSFKKLAETPNSEFVFGGFVAAPTSVAGRPWTVETFVPLADPGFAKVAMNFRL